jgi:membrane dipeptidase
LRFVVIGLGVLVLLVVVVGFVGWWFGPEQFDRRMNRVLADPTAPTPSADDRAFHQSLFIVDLHADTLKWERDLLRRAGFGHVDVPRLVEGNVALQVFTIVTSSPIARGAELPGGLCVDGGDYNLAAILAFVQGRPAFSDRERMFHQVRRFKDAVARSRATDGPELRLITNAQDLRRLVADRQAGQAVIGAILGLEGGHWVGDPAAGSESVEADVRELFDLGVRQFSLTHRFDNQLSGSSEGCERYGLTPLGREAVEIAERLGIAIDLAHISPAGLHEALGMVTRPVVVSHTGIQAGCEPPCRLARNLSDAEIRLILANGGLIGVGYWPQAVGASAWRIADVMAHITGIAAAMGLEPGRHVALGSDYDGSVTPFFDASRIDILTTIMRHRDEPFDQATIRAIAGQNACRFFARVLPGGSETAAEEICAALTS